MKVNNLTEEQQKDFLNNENYGISNIVLYEQIQHFCPLGEQVCVTSYEIKVIPNKQLAELVDLHYKYLTMSGTKFTLESGLKKVLDITREAYTDALQIEVVASCGTNRHMAGKFSIVYNAES